MVSISRAAPAASNMRSVALMISGPMPSPWATVMGVFVDIREHLGYWNAPRRATRLRSLFLQPVVFGASKSILSEIPEVWGCLSTQRRWERREKRRENLSKADRGAGFLQS